MGRVTIADVAKKANVSKSTVSQYLNKRYDYMGEETKKRIELVIDELNYSPNILARSLKQKKTTTIGVIVANILYSFSTQVVRAIEDFCHELNFQVIMCNADDDPAKEKHYIEVLLAKQVDGIILFPTQENMPLYKSLIENDYPLVFLDRMIPEIPIETVVLDNKKAVNLAVREFIETGHKNISIVTPPIKNFPRAERVNGYKEALKIANISICEDYIINSELTENHQLLDDLFNLKEPPNAILASNDRALYEVLKYIKANKLKIPNDIAVIGIDDVSYASIYNPAITTIAQPAFEMGKKSAEILLYKIMKKDNYKKEMTHRFEPKLIKRSSC